MKIAVAGATGRIGRPVVEILAQRGHEVVSMSRATGVDVVTGSGLDEALAGVDVIVDAATGPSPEQQAATEFFAASAKNLLDAGVRAGVQYAVVVSIVNIENFVGGYGAAKVVQEHAWQSGAIPTRIVRATQFHEFVGEIVGWSTQGDVAYLPEIRTQVVAARAAAEVVADAVETPDGPEIVDVAGPRVENIVNLANLIAARQGTPLKIESVPAPDDPDLQMQVDGGLLPEPGGALLVGPTFEEWLEGA